MRALSLAALLSTTVFATGAFASEKRELGSHEHGHATLQIAVEGDRVEMKIEVPGESVVGFEHAAENDEQKRAVEEAQATFGDPTKLFLLPEAAGCTVAEAEVEIHQEGDHNAFEAEYALDCTNVGAITSLETRLFALYPEIEEIEVEYATPAGQGKGELEPDAVTLTLPSTS